MQSAPESNGKQEAWWNQIEGRLLPMLEGVPDLTVAQLNQATLAWLEMEYHRRPHRELDQHTPLQRFLAGQDVARPAPAPEALREAFTAEILRTQRHSDGTFTLQGRRFEVPSRYRHWRQLHIRHAAWDLSQVYLADPHAGTLLCRLYPQDKTRNAQGHRAPKPPLVPDTPAAPSGGMAPLLQKILRDYATTGLPPAYLPKDDLPTCQHE